MCVVEGKYFRIDTKMGEEEKTNMVFVWKATERFNVAVFIFMEQMNNEISN